MSRHHQAGPGSERGDEGAACSGAQEPGDESEASPGGRSVCALFFFFFFNTPRKTLLYYYAQHSVSTAITAPLNTVPGCISNTVVTVLNVLN